MKSQRDFDCDSIVYGPKAWKNGFLKETIFMISRIVSLFFSPPPFDHRRVCALRCAVGCLFMLQPIHVALFGVINKFSCSEVKANEFHEIFNLSYDGDFSDIPRNPRAQLEKSTNSNSLELFTIIWKNIKIRVTYQCRRISCFFRALACLYSNLKDSLGFDSLFWRGGKILIFFFLTLRFLPLILQWERYESTTK